MSDRNEPAFPINGGLHDNQFNGMSLRDYFAATATEEDVDYWQRHYVDSYNGKHFPHTGLMAAKAPSREEAKFRYADAMLAAGAIDAPDSKP